MEDDFNRLASTDIGDDWDEQVGDWEIVAGTLSGPASGIVHTTLATGDTNGEMKILVVCKDVESGDRFRILVNYDIDTDYYQYVQLECTGSGTDNMTLSVGVNDAGGPAESDSYTFSHDINVDMYLVVCRNLEGIYASTSDVSVTVWKCQTPVVGQYAGLMNASDTNTIAFDDFLFIRPWDGTTRCFTCSCECEGECMPGEFRLTFQGDGLCNCIDDEYVDITLVDHSDTIYWNGSGYIYNIDGCSFQVAVEFKLICAPDLESWILQDIGNYPSGYPATTGWSYGGTYNQAHPNMDISTCSPLYVVFGPFQFTVSEPCDPCDCTYYIELTEVP